MNKFAFFRRDLFCSLSFIALIIRTFDNLTLESEGIDYFISLSYNILIIIKILNKIICPSLKSKDNFAVKHHQLLSVAVNKTLIETTAHLSKANK